MNYLLAVILSLIGSAILVWNKPLSQKLGSFYSQRFASTFGPLAHLLTWDDPTRPFNRFLYRSFVVVAGLIFLIFALAALTGTNFVGPSSSPTIQPTPESHGL
jgi:hypothetical protein